jgi:putative protease
MLAHFGADELYFGIMTPEWEEHFGGTWWMNRRSPASANLHSWAEVEDVTEQAHARSIPVYVTLNAPFYASASIPYLLKLTERLLTGLHIGGLIVSDLNFLMLLNRKQFPTRIHLSSLGSCFNSMSADFYRSLGVSRIILPRQLRLREIRHLVTNAHPGMEFELFALNDGCYFEEGFCQVSHALGPFCLTDWEVTPHKSTTGLSARDLEAHIQHLKEYLWYQNNCGSSFQANGLPNGPCSLCWFGHFRDWGVAAVKIVGREASFHRKMASIQLVKAVIDEVKEGRAPEEIARTARSIRNTPEYCDTGYMCYFRDS